MQTTPNFTSNGPLEGWTTDEATIFLGDLAIKFKGYTGLDLAELTQEQVVLILGDPAEGVKLFNALKRKKAPPPPGTFGTSEFSLKAVADFLPSVGKDSLLNKIEEGWCKEQQRKHLGDLSPSFLLPVVKSTSWIVDLRFLPLLGHTHKPLQQVLARIGEDSALPTAQPPILLIGPSGCGKTWTIMQIATQYYTVIVDCTQPYFLDMNYERLSHDVHFIYISTTEEKITTETISTWHDKKKAQVNSRVQLDLLARTLLLYLLIGQVPQLTPTQYRDCQLNGGAQVISGIVSKLINLPSVTISKITHNLKSYLKERGHHLVVAIDEAHAAVMDCGDFIVSQTALSEKKQIYNDKNEVFSEYQRGILTPLVMMGHVWGTVVAASPSVDLKLPDAVSSDKSKPQPLVIQCFEPKTPSELNDFFLQTLNLSKAGYMIPPAKKRMFECRFRWCETLVIELAHPGKRLRTAGRSGAEIKTQTEFEAVVDNVIALNKKSVSQYFHKIRDLPLLCKLVRASLLRGLLYEPVVQRDNISSNQEGDQEWQKELEVLSKYWSAWYHYTKYEHESIETSNFFVTQTDEGDRWCIAEPLVLEAAIDYLRTNGMDVATYTSYSLLRDTLEELGRNTSAKGLPLQQHVFETLAVFLDGKSVNEVLKHFGFTDLPEWGETKMHVKSIGTIEELVDLESGTRLFPHPADVFIKPVPQYLVIASNPTRADGILYIDEKYPLTIGCALYNTPINYKEKNLDQLSSTDVRCAFLSKEGNVTKGGVEQRNRAPPEFWDKLTNGIRLMVLLPGVSQSSFETALIDHKTVVECAKLPNKGGGMVDNYTEYISPPWSYYDESSCSYVIYITTRNIGKLFDENTTKLLQFAFHTTDKD